MLKVKFNANPAVVTAGIVIMTAARAVFSANDNREQLNVLLITADDMNCDTVGIYGCKVPGITPNIDKLASEGIRFINAHVTVGVCQPSRSVLMTGVTPTATAPWGLSPCLTIPRLYRNNYFLSDTRSGFLEKLRTSYRAPQEFYDYEHDKNCCKK